MIFSAYFFSSLFLPLRIFHYSTNIDTIYYSAFEVKNSTFYTLTSNMIPAGQKLVPVPIDFRSIQGRQAPLRIHVQQLSIDFFSSASVYTM